jgi:hypothetical protein
MHGISSWDQTKLTLQTIENMEAGNGDQPRAAKLKFSN